MEPKVDSENPWNIHSLYDLQFFNCPSCEFKIHSGQDFADHAFSSHEECQEYLPNIKDDSLDGVICPWKTAEQEIKAEDIFDEYEDELEKSEIDISIIIYSLLNKSNIQVDIDIFPFLSKVSRDVPVPSPWLITWQMRG